MPLFYTPKPRQFNYRPRFYDPEKERWEALKQKYADERLRKELLESDNATAVGTSGTDNNTEASTDDELAYFQKRVRQLDSEERTKSRNLTWKDLFRKREMPTWNYQPRFSEAAGQHDDETAGKQGTGERIAQFKRNRINIKRRFDVTDTDYMKPIPAGRIMLYALLVCLLLYWILF